MIRDDIWFVFPINLFLPQLLLNFHEPISQENLKKITLWTTASYQQSVNSHASLVPPSSCKWGPAGCPGRSGASTQGRGPAPRTAPSGWCTAGRSRSELSRPHWFLSLGHLRTGSPRWGRLYLLRHRRGQGRSRHSVHYLVHTLQHVSESPFVKEGDGEGLERERLLSSQQSARVSLHLCCRSDSQVDWIQTTEVMFYTWLHPLMKQTYQTNLYV